MIRRQISRSARTAFYHSGLFHLLLALNRGTAFILMLHRLRPPLARKTDHAGVAQERFEDLVRFLKRRLCPLTVEELVAARSAAGMFPRKAVCVTFDDGFRDVYEHALPVLSALRVPATVFVTTGFADGRVVPWWESFRALLADPRAKAAVVSRLKQRHVIAQGDRGPSTGASGREVERCLRALPPAEIGRIEADVRAELGIEGVSSPQMMSWDEVREMSRAGVEIAAHTATHPNVARLSDAQLADEIESPKLVLERQLSRRVAGFAYPFGQREDISPAAVAAVRDAGYVYACSACEGAVRRDADVFALKRVSIPDDCLPMAASAFLKHLV